MLTASATLALGAAMLAALNPCGFALLPAYLTLLVTGDQPSRSVAVVRALTDTFALARAHCAVTSALSTDSRTGALGLYAKVGMGVTSVWVNRAITL